MTQLVKVRLFLVCLFVSGTLCSSAQLPTNNDPGNQIRFQKRWEAEKRRDKLIRFFWDDGLPTGILPAVTPDVTDQALSTHLKLIDEKLVDRVDQLEVESLGLTSLIYLIHPLKKADGPELAIVQAGHSPSGTNLNTSYQSTIDLFLASGYSVMMVHMPMYGWNMDHTAVLPNGKKISINPDGPDKPHDIIVKLPEGEGCLRGEASLA